MKKWEYTVLVTDKPLVEELNNMGSEGWELVFMMPQSPESYILKLHPNSFIFKRELV